LSFFFSFLGKKTKTKTKKPYTLNGKMVTLKQRQKFEGVSLLEGRTAAPSLNCFVSGTNRQGWYFVRNTSKCKTA
jgi:hypothetical protein